MIRTLWLPLVGLWLWNAAAAAPGAIFVLANGGQIDGEWLNANEPKRHSYVVRTATGGRLVLPAKQVTRVETRSDAAEWYEAELPKMPPTVAGHWAMAEECKRRGLKEQREFHLRQIIELDPEHKDARYALGYSRVEDRWVKPDEVMGGQGYVRHRGAWRIAQEVALEKATDEVDRQQKEWSRKIKIWRQAIEKGRGKEGEAIDAIRAIADPFAARALADVAADSGAGYDLRRLCLDALARLKSPIGVKTFTRLAVEDPDRQIRDACLDQLQRFGTAAAARTIERALQSGDNARVNRAGRCLGVLKQPESTLPLINALVTEHKFILQTEGGGPGQYNLGFGGGGGTSGNTFSAGGRPQVIKRQLQNEGVLEGLTAIHRGTNFGYDVDAWKNWHAQREVPAVVNLRRND